MCHVYLCTTAPKTDPFLIMNIMLIKLILRFRKEESFGNEESFVALDKARQQCDSCDPIWNSVKYSYKEGISRKLKVLTTC